MNLVEATDLREPRADRGLDLAAGLDTLPPVELFCKSTSLGDICQPIPGMLPLEHSTGVKLIAAELEDAPLDPRRRSREVEEFLTQLRVPRLKHGQHSLVRLCMLRYIFST
jgi:hypothetical protein